MAESGNSPQCGFGLFLMPRLSFTHRSCRGAVERAGVSPVHVTACSSILFLLHLSSGVLTSLCETGHLKSCFLIKTEDTKGACGVKELSYDRPCWLSSPAHRCHLFLLGQPHTGARRAAHSFVPGPGTL